MKRTMLFLATAAVLLAVGGEAAWAGTRVRSSRVEARCFDTWTYRACGRCAMVRVIVDGDGDTDLDLLVYDDDGDRIASDTDCTDYCVVRFWASRGHSYRLVVVNHGNVWNRYTITIRD